MSSCNGAFLFCFCFILKIIILHVPIVLDVIPSVIFYELSYVCVFDECRNKINPTVSLGLWTEPLTQTCREKEHSIMSTGWCWNPRRWVCSRGEFDIILMNLKKERMKGDWEYDMERIHRNSLMTREETKENRQLFRDNDYLFYTLTRI